MKRSSVIAIIFRDNEYKKRIGRISFSEKGYTAYLYGKKKAQAKTLKKAERDLADSTGKRFYILYK